MVKVKSSEVKKILREESSKSLRLKELRKRIGDLKGVKGEDVKEALKETINKMKEKKSIQVEDKVVSLVADKKDTQEEASSSGPSSEVGKKRKADQAEGEAKKPKAAAAEERQEVDESSNNGGTRLFLGNLSFDITEEKLKSAIPGVTHVKWITDKATKQFYGSAFVEMKNHRAAQAAVGLAGSNIAGRPLKAKYAPARPGDVWPPVTQAKSAAPTREPSAKPYDECCKLFIGNLSYELDDDTLRQFFQECGEIMKIRWLTHKDSGDFRGCGYIEFDSSAAADQAILLNGQSLLSRPIRIDWDSH